MSIIAEKFKKEALPQMRKEFGGKSDMAIPRILKVVINVGVGRFSKEEQVKDVIVKALTLISGQKPESRPARKSIASFKIREGTVVGQRVTLRGKRMYDFLDRLINVALPRTRDFRGIDPKSVDNQGNLTIGIREHTIFPELIQENIKTLFGLEISVVTSAKNREESLRLMELLGFPFKKK
jgi:large subunit ribosomal protein L5